jgi:hypothetical protein
MFPLHIRVVGHSRSRITSTNMEADQSLSKFDRLRESCFAILEDGSVISFPEGEKEQWTEWMKKAFSGGNIWVAKNHVEGFRVLQGCFAIGQNLNITLSLLLMGFLLFGCGRSVNPVPTPTPTWTPAPTSTPILTPTVPPRTTPFPQPTPIPTPSPAPVQSPSVSASPSSTPTPAARAHRRRRHHHRGNPT